MSDLNIAIIDYVQANIRHYLFSAFPSLLSVDHIESIPDAYSSSDKAEVQDLRFEYDQNTKSLTIQSFVFLLPFEKSAAQAIQDAIARELTFEQAMKIESFKTAVLNYLVQITDQIGEKTGIKVQLKPKEEPKVSPWPYIAVGVVGIGLIWYFTKDSDRDTVILPVYL